jgi:hypothetical protein
VFRRARTHVEVIVQADEFDNASAFQMGGENSIRRRTGRARDDRAVCGERLIAKKIIKGFALNRPLNPRVKGSLGPKANKHERNLWSISQQHD